MGRRPRPGAWPMSAWPTTSSTRRSSGGSSASSTLPELAVAMAKSHFRGYGRGTALGDLSETDGDLSAIVRATDDFKGPASLSSSSRPGCGGATAW